MGTSRGLDIERQISREEGSFPGTVQTNRVLRMSRSMQDLKISIAQAQNLAINQQDLDMGVRRKSTYLRVITRHDYPQASRMVGVAMR